MINRLAMPAVLQLINPEVHDFSVSWSTSQFWDLSKYAMNTLIILVPKMPTEFLKRKGPLRYIFNSKYLNGIHIVFFDNLFLRLIMMLEWSMTIEFDSIIIMNLVKTICSIITINSTMILEDFCEQGVVISLTSKD